MSFLEDMAGKEVSGMLANSSNPLASSVMQMINSQPGGLSGLIQQFHDKGLGGLVSSWVSTGQNLPISADQIQHVLSVRMIADLGVIAGHTQKVLDPAHRAAQHIGLNRDPIAMLAGHLHNRLDPQLAHHHARAQRRHPSNSALIIGQVNRVDSIAHAQRQPFKRSARGTLGRGQLAGYDHLAGLEPALKRTIACHGSLSLLC